MIWAIVGLLLALNVFVLWACCATAGRISRMEEQQEWEEWIKEHKK